MGPTATDAPTVQTALPEELEVLSAGAGMFDRSERGKLALSGADAIEFLNGQITNELDGLRPGEGRYAAFLTHKGKMLGDLRVLAVRDGAGDELMLTLDTERVALQALFDMIQRFKVGYHVELHKHTLERGLISLIGPRASALAGVEELPAAEHSNSSLRLEELELLAARTDVGVDLFCASAERERLSSLLAARGAQPVSEQAVECLRIERGRPRYGLDLDESTIPQEAGLNERAVSFTKGCYVGQETVARLFYRGKPNRYLRGLRLSAPAEHGTELRLGDRVVGTLGSSALSPRLGPIGLAIVRREAQPGDTLTIGSDGAGAELLELPFPGA